MNRRRLVLRSAGRDKLADLVRQGRVRPTSDGSALEDQRGTIVAVLTAVEDGMYIYTGVNRYAGEEVVIGELE